MKLEIDIPDEFAQTYNLQAINNQTWCEIIQSVCELQTKFVGQDLLQIVKQQLMQETRQQVIEEITTEKMKHQLELSEHLLIRDNLQQQIKSLTDQQLEKEKLLMEQNNIKGVMQQQIIDQMMLRIKDLTLQIENNKTLDTVNATITQMSQYYVGGNITKGNLGEQKIMDILNNRYPNAQMKDCSGIPHSGDIQFVLGKLNLMIEIKNKKTIVADDIQKFMRDMHENDTCAGLFVSLATNAISGYTDTIRLDYYLGKPCVYVYFTGADIIYTAISILYNLAHQQQLGAHQSDLIVNHFKNSFQFLNDLIASFDKQIILIHKQLRDSSKMRDACVAQHVTYTNLMQHVPDLMREIMPEEEIINISTVEKTKNTLLYENIYQSFQHIFYQNDDITTTSFGKYRFTEQTLADFMMFAANKFYTDLLIINLDTVKKFISTHNDFPKANALSSCLGLPPAKFKTICKHFAKICPDINLYCANLYKVLPVKFKVVDETTE